MADPDLKKGFARIANELLEALCCRKFTLQEIDIILCIWRFTYGYGEKMAIITFGRMEKTTLISRAHCSNTVTNLIRKGVLRRQVTPEGSMLMVVRDCDKWKVLRRQVTVTQPGNRGVTPSGNKGVTQLGNPRKKSERNLEIKDPLSPPRTKNKKPLTLPPENLIVSDHNHNLFIKKYGPAPIEALQHQSDCCMDHHRANGNVFADWNAVLRTWFKNWQTDFGKIDIAAVRARNEKTNNSNPPEVDVMTPQNFNEERFQGRD